MQTKRMHVVIPENTIKAIDSVVGRRKRSQFIFKVLEEKLQQLKVLKAIDKTAGAWKDEDHPEMKGKDGVKNWVNSLRQESNRKLTD